MVRSVLPLVAALAASALGQSCTLLTEAPYVTEAIVILAELSTTISTTGVVTLGVDFPEASGLDCVAKTTTITAAPTVCAVTALTTALTSSRCSTATTFASCDVCGECTSADLYCWNPPPPPPPPPASQYGGGGGSGSGTCVAVGGESTVTETVTKASVVTKEPTTVTVVRVTATDAEIDTVTVTSTVTPATVTLPPITDIVTSFVTMSGLGYNRTVSVTTHANGTTTMATATTTVTVTATADFTITQTSTSTAPPVTDDISVTETITITAPPSSSPSASSCSAAAPTLTCDKYGYLIQSKALIRIDLASGQYDEVTADVGSQGLVNALGYNVLDNYLYGRDADANTIVRISADGTSERVAELTETISGVVGDVDNEGNYWYAEGEATTWYQHDLLPGSPTYGTVLNKGTNKATGRRIYDWVYIPVTGRYLWTIGTESPDSGSDLMKWSLDTFTWTIVANYPDIATQTFGALYGMNNGTIYASDNASGFIWAFDTSDAVAPFVVSEGPISSSNDGARCVLNTSV